MVICDSSNKKLIKLSFSRIFNFISHSFFFGLCSPELNDRITILGTAGINRTGNNKDNELPFARQFNWPEQKQQVYLKLPLAISADSRVGDSPQGIAYWLILQVLNWVRASEDRCFPGI